VTRPTRALAAVAVAIAAAAVLIACPPQNLPKPIPPPVPAPGYDPQPGGSRPPDAAPSSPSSPSIADPFSSPPQTPRPAPAAAGAACTGPGDCASGICEGQGCGTATGVCAPAQRACTYDIRQYCGCDGITFSASGSCPGTRYQSRGACGAGTGAGAPSSPAKPLPAGASCLAGAECDSGVCEGAGCGADTPGVCAAKSRRCTRDRRAFCGCDGKTFFGSSSCPGGRYAKPGSCPS
jgi:hypothetical protein